MRLNFVSTLKVSYCVQLDLVASIARICMNSLTFVVFLYLSVLRGRLLVSFHAVISDLYIDSCHSSSRSKIFMHYWLVHFLIFLAFVPNTIFCHVSCHLYGDFFAHYWLCFLSILTDFSTAFAMEKVCVCSLLLLASGTNAWWGVCGICFCLISFHFAGFTLGRFLLPLWQIVVIMHSLQSSRFIRDVSCLSRCESWVHSCVWSLSVQSEVGRCYTENNVLYFSRAPRLFCTKSVFMSQD